LLVIGLLVYVLGRSQGITIFEVGALAPVLAGVLLTMRGWPALRVFWFTILFMAYLAPLPGFFVDAMTLPLKQNASENAARFLYAVGYPVAHDGVILIVGQYYLLVADACSGLNSMFSLSAAGLIYLYLTQRKSWPHNVLILASLLPIAFLANFVCVIILVLVTYHFGDAAGQGFVHSSAGLMMFMIELMIISVLDRVLAMIIKPREAAR
jgi:exosortase B